MSEHRPFQILRIGFFEDFVCVKCDKRLKGKYYGLPGWYIRAHGYGSCRNDAHCIECHDELMAKKGECIFCR